MKKRLSFLLFLPTILISYPAWCGWPPLIGQIPSPIIGNYTDATSHTQYVYPDVFDLHALAIDDNFTPYQLKWTYDIYGGGAPIYSINGIQPNSSGSIDPVNPPENRVLNHTVAGGEINPDGMANTITIRNQRLSPLGGPTSSTLASGFIDIQAITFYLAGENGCSSSTVAFYTDPNGSSRLSTGYAWTRVFEDRLSGHSWPMADPFYDHTTSCTWTDGRGVCLKVTKEGNNWGSVATPMGNLTLTDNTVYRVRLTMNCDQLSVGKTPFWDFILENWDGDAEKGLNLYGMDSFYLDNQGGANAIIQKGLGNEVIILWAPAAYQTNQWRSTTTGVFAMNPVPPAGNGIDYHLKKDARLRFRVMDLDARADLQNNQKFGMICLQNVIIEACPISRRIYEATGTSEPPATGLYSATSLKKAHGNPNDPVPGNVWTTSLLGSTLYFNNGTLTITPVGSARDNEIVTITPAIDLLYEPGTWATIADDWPIAWETGKVYELKVELSAPSKTDADHPFDVFWMNMEPPTNEVITESYVTANHAIATPREGTPQPYYMYYYSGHRTNSSIQAYRFLRWRLRFGNNTNCDWPELSNTQNTGAVRVHSVTVNKVYFQ